MRVLPERPVKVRGKVIGGEEPQVCVPLVARDEQELSEQADRSLTLGPDLLEWRADGYARIADLQEAANALNRLGQVAGNTPVIFTCRLVAEGGLQDLPLETRRQLWHLAIETGNASLVDVELATPPGIIHEVVTKAHDCGVPVILSYHDFQRTPPVREITERLYRMQHLGADIAKVAVMPESQVDVLRLFQATTEARASGLKIPVIAISMGPLGAISRLAGWLFGSDLIFAAAGRSSAPGQLPLDLVRQAVNLLREAGQRG